MKRRDLLIAAAAWGLARTNAAAVPPVVLRTPDASFENLDGFSFTPGYTRISDATLGTLRMHSVDVGPREADPIVLLHGQPSWSYLYRKMISPLAAAGHRVLAPDLIGYGRSDKPARRQDYSYAAHVAWVRSWFRANNLSRITLVVHDWGGMIGLRIVAAEPERFARLVILNTSLPDGTDRLPNGYAEKYEKFRDFLLTTPVLRPSMFIAPQTFTTLSGKVLAAYDAPYPTDDLTAGPRVMTSLIPFRPDDPGAAENALARRRLERLPMPTLLAFSVDSDRVHPGQHALFRKLFEGRLWRDETVANSRHFLQEDKGEELAQLVNQFIEGTPA